MRLRSLLPAAMLLVLPAAVDAQEFEFPFGLSGGNFNQSSSTFSFTWTQPVVGTFNWVFLNLTGSVNNGTLNPNGPGGFYLNVYTRNGAVQTLVGSFGSGACIDVEAGATPCTLTPSGGATFFFAPLTTTHLFVDMDFSASAGSSFVFNGVARLQNVSTVPEPSTWALMASGLLVIGGVGARRNRRHA